MMQNLIKDDLLSVQKPARYVGGEYNQISKANTCAKCRFAFCFPDIYEVGILDFKLNLVYQMLNSREDTWCERVFMPCPDFENVMKKDNIELYGIESKDSIKDFDLVYFSLNREIEYINILHMLSLSNIPILSKNRGEEIPFVIACGITNIVPLEPFIDIFIIGEEEIILNKLIQKYVEWKEKKLPKVEFLKKIKELQGIYIPSLHNKTDIIRKTMVDNLDDINYPSKVLVPNINIMQNKIPLELSRGNANDNCRVCQENYINRPYREKSDIYIYEQIKKLFENSGIDKIKLVSSNISDYSKIESLNSLLKEYCNYKNVNISFSNIQVDTINFEVLKNIKAVDEVIFNIYAGSNKLRAVINKNITEEKLLDACKIVFENGAKNIKINYMIGLPLETYEDIDEIVILSKKVLNLCDNLKESIRKECNISLYVKNFIPRAYTPFQWCAQNAVEKIELKQKYLKEKLDESNILVEFDNAKLSMIEAILSRGDKSVSDILYQAYKNGAKYLSLNKEFDFEPWQNAFENLNINPKKYACIAYDVGYKFEWDNILYGIEKSDLIEEYNKIGKIGE